MQHFFEHRVDQFYKAREQNTTYRAIQASKESNKTLT